MREMYSFKEVKAFRSFSTIAIFSLSLMFASLSLLPFGRLLGGKKVVILVAETVADVDAIVE